MTKFKPQTSDRNSEAPPQCNAAISPAVFWHWTVQARGFVGAYRRSRKAKHLLALARHIRGMAARATRSAPRKRKGDA